MARRAIDWTQPDDNPAGVVFGLTTIGMLLAAESGLHETYLQAIGSSIVAMLLYWLAHAYANLLGRRLQTGERLTATALAQTFIHDWAIVRGAGVPLLALLIAWASGASLSSAISVGIWTSVASLIAFELLAGVRAKASTGELLLEASIGATMGLAIVVLRVILH
jgi:membrane protein YqaA with SNARE-associated domain